MLWCEYLLWFALLYCALHCSFHSDVMCWLALHFSYNSLSRTYKQPKTATTLTLMISLLSSFQSLYYICPSQWMHLRWQHHLTQWKVGPIKEQLMWIMCWAVQIMQQCKFSSVTFMWIYSIPICFDNRGNKQEKIVKLDYVKC